MTHLYIATTTRQESVDYTTGRLAKQTDDKRVRNTFNIVEYRIKRIIKVIEDSGANELADYFAARYNTANNIKNTLQRAEALKAINQEMELMIHQERERRNANI